MPRAALLLVLAAALALPACRTTPVARGYPSIGDIERLDPAFDALVPPGARLERLAEGFEWTEGPVWRRSGGYLLFTDIPRNTIYRWKEGEGVSVFLRPAGWTRPDPPGDELGSNGLTFDAQDRLVMADHGNRQIARLDETNYTKTALVERYQGRRLNTPNDLVYRSNGDLFFTDPPYGLRGLNQNPTKELDYNGVYRLSPAGELTLLERGLSFPNGIALSPDERTLYVANSDPRRAIWTAYDLRPDGSVANGRVLFDATPLARQGRQGAPDGMKVDRAGNLFATGPGGVLVLSPDGRHLGTIRTGQATSNVAFGDDGSSLYITADMYLLRIRLSTKGAGF
jgi:gluconolactonase